MSTSTTEAGERRILNMSRCQEILSMVRLSSLGGIKVLNKMEAIGMGRA